MLGDGSELVHGVVGAGSGVVTTVGVAHRHHVLQVVEPGHECTLDPPPVEHQLQYRWLG